MRLIDADALFDRVYDKYGESLDEGPANMFMDWINEAPTIDPEIVQPQWIPVAERLPDENQPVCILLENGNVFRAEIRIRELLKGWWYRYDPADEDMDMLGIHYEVEGWLKENPIVAWLPLPEPYTADAEENEGVQTAHWEKADIPLPYQMRTVPTPSGTFAHREMYVCSACDGYNDQNTQYCPHCGARMDRKDENG